MWLVVKGVIPLYWGRLLLHRYLTIKYQNKVNEEGVGNHKKTMRFSLLLIHHLN